MSSIITTLNESIKSPLRHKPYLIGISGGSGGGKTSVANLIFKSIGAEYSLLFSMDTYYKDLTPEQEKNLSNYNFDSPEALDLDLLYQHLNDLMHWKNIKMPTYDFSKNKRNSYTIDLKPAKVIVFEGILAFYDKRMRDLMDLKLFIDLDDDIRLSRRIFRDIISRGRNMETVLDRYHKFVKPAYNNFIKPTKEYADIIIPRGGSNTIAIDLINYHLKYLIENVTFINDKGDKVGGVNDEVREEFKKYPSCTLTFYNDIKTIEAIKKEKVFTNKNDINSLVNEKEQDMFLDMYKNYLKGEKKEYYDLYMDIYTQKIKEEIDKLRKDKEDYVKDDLIFFSNDSKEKIDKMINEKIEKLKDKEYIDLYFFINDLISNVNGFIDIGGREAYLGYGVVIPSEGDLCIMEDKSTYVIQRWTPLNSKNYAEYCSMESLAEKVGFLENTLVGNILSAAKGLGIHFEQQVECRIVKISDPYIIRNKGVKIMAFDALFKSNVSLPDNIGLGKHASIGHGTISAKPGIETSA